MEYFDSTTRDSAPAFTLSRTFRMSHPSHTQHLPVSSRRMPLRKPHKPSIPTIAVGVVLLLGFLYLATTTALHVFSIKGLIAIGILLLVAWYSIRRSRDRLIEQRGDPTIDKFIQPLDARMYDPVVVRAVYEILAKRCHPVQVLPDDDLVKTFFGDDLELVEISMEFDDWFEIDLDAAKSAPGRQIRTARDLIVYFEELLKAKQKGAA